MFAVACMSLAAVCRPQAATSKLDEDRRQLQEWGGRLAALTREFDDARQEVKAARTEIEGQRALLTQQVRGCEHVLLDTGALLSLWRCMRTLRAILCGRHCPHPIVIIHHWLVANRRTEPQAKSLWPPCCCRCLRVCVLRTSHTGCVTVCCPGQAGGATPGPAGRTTGAGQVCVGACVLCVCAVSCATR